MMEMYVGVISSYIHVYSMYLSSCQLHVRFEAPVARRPIIELGKGVEELMQKKEPSKKPMYSNWV